MASESKFEIAGFSLRMRPDQSNIDDAWIVLSYNGKQLSEKFAPSGYKHQMFNAMSEVLSKTAEILQRQS